MASLVKKKTSKTAMKSLENSIALEYCAKMAIDCWNIDENLFPIPQYILDKHFLRKHGPEAYYGQNTTDLESL